MSEELITGVVLHGESDQSPEAWASWIKDAVDALSNLNLRPTHISAKSNSLRWSKVAKYSSGMEVINEKLVEGDCFQRITLYVLPKVFDTVAYDYKVFVGRNEKAIFLVAANELNIDTGNIMTILRKHISAKKGEVFQMDRHETPLEYIRGVCDKKDLKSLKVIRRN